MEIEQEILNIKERNKKVESDKAWERSWTRRMFIAGVTYLTAAVWLIVIHDSMPFLKAFVPVVGYILSTLSLPPIKKFWIKNH